MLLVVWKRIAEHGHVSACAVLLLSNLLRVFALLVCGKINALSFK